MEDRNGQVGYAPAAFLMVILDTSAEEEESSATKKGLENSTDENQIGGWVGQEGERRKSYSAAVIDGIKRNSRIYVGDSIVRKTDTRLSKEEDVVVCLPEDVGYVDMWDSFVGKEEIYVRDGLHLSGKGLPFLPRDCQGRLPVAWVKYII